MSHSEHASCFRTTAGDTPAARARLGRPSFVDFHLACSVPAGFVFEHARERPPAGVQCGFCHRGLGQLGAVHIADDDQFVLTPNPGGLLVQVVASSIGDLGLDDLNAALVGGRLSNLTGLLALAMVPRCRDLGSVSAGCRTVQTKVDPDRSVAGREVVGALALKAEIPSVARVLREAASLELAARLPNGSSPRWTVSFSPATVKPITRTVLSNTCPSSQSPSWSTCSRARRAGCPDKSGQTLRRDTGRGVCGHQATLSLQPQARRWKQSSGMSNNGAPPPRHEGRVFRRGVPR